jgi:hypothetical protein
LARIFKNAPASQRKLLIHVAETARLRQIAVHGRSASVVWTATVTGKSVKFSHGARLVGGEWKFVDTGNGSPQSQ